MSFPTENATVHVVGAGLAGLNAALQLADVGVPVQVYEASAHAGGRCRSYHDTVLNREIDNGNHLIMMANTDTLWLMTRLGAHKHFAMPQESYYFVDLDGRKRWHYTSRTKPPGMKLADAYRLLQLIFADPNTRVRDIFHEHSIFYRRFVEPLCTAALNTHPDDASARLFGRVIRALMRPGAAHYPTILTTYGQALIEPMMQAIRDGGGEIRFQRRLTRVEAEDDRLTHLHFGQEIVTLGPQDKVILAVPPDAAAALFEIEVPEGYNRIVNGHFLYDTTGIGPSLIGVIGSPLQWVFVKDGLISTTTSDAERSELAGLSQAQMAAKLWRDACKALEIGEPPLPTHRIIVEKKATFAATPENEARRLGPVTPYRNLVLAGDWLQTGLPATIEGAIFSGRRAADWCLRSNGG